MRAAPERQSPAPAQALVWLWFTALVTVAPHGLHLPPWLSALCVALLAWQGWLLFGEGGLAAPAPSRLRRVLVLIIAAATALAVRAEYGQLLGKDPGIALLAVLLCLKLLEHARGRDVRAGVLLAFFLQLGLFLHDQSLPVAIAAMVGIWLACTTLLALHDTRASRAVQARTGAVLMAQALPFLLAFFVLFPRIPGPLWGMPADAWSGMSGLSDTMSPGSISELTLSDAIAFRAEFDGPLPAPAERYWRGPVLTEFDGRTWRATRAELAGQPFYTPGGTPYRYRITLEPHNQPWVLALDYPGAGHAPLRYASDFRLLTPAPVRSRARFDLDAWPASHVGVDEDTRTLAAATRLPEGSNPRTRALARELAEAGDGAPEAVLARMLDHLRMLGLEYTLNPPLLGDHATDAFLFEAQRGFCEHFAAALTVMLRAAEIPARVVTGYQGGERNPVDGTLVVRQSDAHAWVEAWLPGQGWVRVDPTAVAAPERIEWGLASALPAGEARPFMMREGLDWLRTVRHRWEALSNNWNQWVLGYDRERQRQLLQRLGLDEPHPALLTGLIIVISMTLMAALTLVWQRRRAPGRDPADRAWQEFCKRMARAGVPRLQWEGPMAYARRAGAALPDQASTIDAIASRYARLCYAPPSPEREAELRQFSRLVHTFEPR